MNAFVKQPPSATAIQTPMSFAYVITSLYPEIVIPPQLSGVRMKFLDESTGATVKDFYLSLLLSLRKDLVLLSNLLRDVLTRDRPPPIVRRRSWRQRMYILSVSHCQICGSKFGARRRTKTGSVHFIKRQFDHDHFLAYVMMNHARFARPSIAHFLWNL